MTKNPSSEVLIRRINRRSPYRVLDLPLLAKIYRYPYLRWSSVHRRTLFGSPWLLAFALLRRFYPASINGNFELKLANGVATLKFDARNAQFQSLYLPHFVNGYEPEVMALIDMLLPNDGVFFDIGSNWGYFSIYAATNPRFRGRIHAFEPLPSTFSDLSDLVRQAKLETRITCEACALSDFDGIGEMKLPDFIHSGQAALQAKASKPGKIKVAKLDSLNLPPPTLLKIDAEGSEALILAGAVKTISNHRPYIIFENWRDFGAPHRTLAPFALLQKHDYVFFHPAWMRKGNEEAFFVSEGYVAETQSETLALIPVRVDERFLQQDQINILACPAEKVSMLAKNEIGVDSINVNRSS